MSALHDAMDRYAALEREYAAEIAPIDAKYRPLLRAALADIDAMRPRRPITSFRRHKPPHSADGHGPTRSTPGVVGPFNHEGQSK